MLRDELFAKDAMVSPLFSCSYIPIQRGKVSLAAWSCLETSYNGQYMFGDFMTGKVWVLQIGMNHVWV